MSVLLDLSCCNIETLVRIEQNPPYITSVLPIFPGVNVQMQQKLQKGACTMEHEREERAALIAAILPLLEKMPLVWLRATLITVEKRAARKE